MGYNVMDSKATAEGEIPLSDFFQVFFHSAEMIGTVAFAASGAFLAIDREMDLFGVIFLGVITAVGGGILRDVLLGVTPPGAFVSPTYTVVAIFTALVVFLLAELLNHGYWANIQRVDRAFNLLDAIGLGAFSVVGVQTAVGRGFLGNGFLCVVMGMTTGVVGGILRDVLGGITPAVLRKRIYAVASLMGAWLYYELTRLNVDGSVSVLAGMGLTLAIRMLAAHYQWRLPKVPHP